MAGFFPVAVFDVAFVPAATRVVDFLAADITSPYDIITYVRIFWMGKVRKFEEVGNKKGGQSDTSLTETASIWAAFGGTTW
jgi:hypothetical protein